MFSYCIRKTCAHCQKNLGVLAFPRCKPKKFGRSGICKKCYKIWFQEYKAKPKTVPKTKFCNHCSTEKDSSQFFACNSYKDGLTNKCRACYAAYDQSNKAKNLKLGGPRIDEKICPMCQELKSSDQYSKTLSNADGLSCYCRSCDSKRKETPEKIVKRKLREENIKLAKMKKNVSGHVLHSMKKRGLQKNRHKTFDHLPYSAQELYNHLIWTLTLLDGYTEADFHRQQNGRAVLEIDHIKPHSSFLYQSLDDPIFVECWALTNLRLLPAQENLEKGDRYYSEFHDWFIEQMRQDGRLS